MQAESQYHAGNDDTAKSFFIILILWIENELNLCSHSMETLPRRTKEVGGKLGYFLK